ncbi:replication initiator protein A [Paracoccus saliphilus]|uniref:Plasmid replication initiator protein n=1 Tax=Paracoccus saliphilus TaxID=405559 RepID=A0AA46A7K2_9RHOB|nr:replication initiator protein A [Paracoccus saliphilus]WCR05532.1 replication initiator protein A [Paracoccus saliphilus]SIT15060.1 Plasmid replication initiator protein [Paracoccus saliphilus]
MAVRHPSLSERGQLDLFRALPGDFAPRDAQDLMTYPFFSLSKTHRITPIDFVSGNVVIRVEAIPEYGMATIWDADILIWAASQIVEARDAGLRTSRLMVATPYEILSFIGRGNSVRDYRRLKAGLDRLQSTTVSTTIRQLAEGRQHRFSWINEWEDRRDGTGNPDGIEMILPDWFYQAVLDDALILTIDRAFFDLTGGIERWLYRLVRKHGGRQRRGWRFDFHHLHQKSGSLSAFKRFAFDLRGIIRRQALPGYRLSHEIDPGGRSFLAFKPVAPCGKPVKPYVRTGTPEPVPSGTRVTCDWEPRPGLNDQRITENRARNLESNGQSNTEEGGRAVENSRRSTVRSVGLAEKKSELSDQPAGKKSDASASEAPEFPQLLLKPSGRNP